MNRGVIPVIALRRLSRRPIRRFQRGGVFGEGGPGDRLDFDASPSAFTPAYRFNYGNPTGPTTDPSIETPDLSAQYDPRLLDQYNQSFYDQAFGNFDPGVPNFYPQVPFDIQQQQDVNPNFAAMLHSGTVTKPHRFGGVIRRYQGGGVSMSPSAQQIYDEDRDLQRGIPLRGRPGPQFRPRPVPETNLMPEGKVFDYMDYYPPTFMAQDGGVVYPGIALDRSGMPTLTQTRPPQQQPSAVAGEPARKTQKPQQRQKYEFGPADYFYTPQEYEKEVEAQTARMEQGQEGYEDGGVIPREFMQWLAGGGVIKNFTPDHALMFALGMKHALSPQQASKRLKQPEQPADLMPP